MSKYNSDLLKEAICDAKAVRQTALANAKAALEEAFSEKYQAMFSEKLKEDAAMKPEEEEENTQMTADKTEQENVSEQEIDELIKELESEVGTEPGAEPNLDGAPGAPAGTEPNVAPGVPGLPGAPGAQAPLVPCAPTPGAPGIPGTPAAGVQGLPGVPGAPSVPGMENPAMPGEIPGATPEVPGAPQSPPPSDVPPTSSDEEDEDIDLNELLESLKDEISSKEEDEEEEEEGKINEETKLTSSGIGGDKAGGSPNKKPASGTNHSSKLESGSIKGEGFPSIEATKVGPDDATKATRPNQGKNVTSTNLSTPNLSGKHGSKGAARPNEASHATSTDLSTPGGILKENESLKQQLDEALEVVKYVKGQLNEVNLLNAKLLYTNKLFKEYNMNNEHKMRIVEMFDLAKTVREVKLTYANIAESLNFSGNDMKKKVVATTNSSIQSITEGFASKPVGSTKPTKEIISEQSAQVSRFQKLAGIKKDIIVNNAGNKTK